MSALSANAQPPAAPDAGQVEPGTAAAEPPAPAMAQPPPAPASLTVQVDKTSLENGGEIIVTGQAPAGKPVFLEVWAADKTVRANRFDNKKDPKTGQIPYVFYLTYDMPAYYKIFVPKSAQPQLDAIKQEGNKWSFSKALETLGAGAAYTVPATMAIERYKATIMASIIGSRGNLMAAVDDKENKKSSMQLVKARFKDAGKVLGADIEVNPDGTYRAAIQIRTGLAPGKYKIMAVVDKDLRSEPVEFENKINFPLVYLSIAGTSQNIFWPFLITLVISVFGVLMGAGGGFILNPILVSLFPLPHTVVAGTVMPTVLFSQGSGIYNYSKIKFINWKLGCTIGTAMLLGGFIGPKLTELITLDQFKFAFGWILLVLAALMFWQTTPGYLAKNKKEQAIMKEFKKRAEEAAKAKQA
ncbi:MAG: sulfite exporter TauE/SafE family protein [Desulfurivibrio sp.]|nr:MAG: sulfite exporter TauE/SafE family protein [Desulfurivibrio sp.]